MKLARRILAAGAVASLAVTLAACSQEAQSNTLTYWSMWEDDEPQAAILQQAIADFTEETGIEVDVEWQGRSVLTKVAPTIRGGGAPDLVDQDAATLYATLADAHTDLTDLYDEKIADEDVTIRDSGAGSFLSLNTDPEDDTVFSVPYEVFGYGMFYNGAANPDVVQNPPTTFDDFIATLDTLKAAGRQPLAVDGDIGFYQSLWLFTPLQHLLGQDGFDALIEDETGEEWTTNPDVAAALDQVEQLAAGGYWADGSWGSKFPAIQEKWATGESDFLMNGTWLPSEVQNSVDDDWQWNQLAWPADGDATTVLSGTIGFAVPSTAENADAAKEFIGFFLKKEYQQAIADDTSNLVPRSDVEAPAILADLNDAITGGGDVQSVAGTIQMRFPAYTTEVLEPLSLQLLRGELGADEFASQIQSAQAAFWKNQ